MSMKDKHITVWFSCGAASAIAAKLTLDLYGKDNVVRIVNNPVADEHEDNRRFLLDVEKWLDHPIESAYNPKYPDASCVEVWEDKRYMSGNAGAPCTVELKKKARQNWEKQNKSDYIVLGFTSDETSRADRFKLTERDTLLTPLIDKGITKGDCFNMLFEAGVDLPYIYKLGYPNANCIGCVKASSPTYWNLVRETFPDVFDQRCAQSRDIGTKLVRVKGERKFLDELLVTDKGRPIKHLYIECGIFCEEATDNE